GYPRTSLAALGAVRVIPLPVCAPPLPKPRVVPGRYRGPKTAASQHERNTKMIIGNFTYNKAKDTYTGEIKTLTLHRGNVAFRPTGGKKAKGPDYRVVL